MAKTDGKISVLKENIKHYEYEIILFVFLLLRFVFKNILNYKKYFNEKTIFGLSDKECIAIGTVILLAICVLLASVFGRLIRSSGENYEKSVLYLVALFLACPASLPFLFDINSLSGTQMLYPFALFVFSIFLIGKPFFKWLIPIICAAYFIPAVYTSEVFFEALHKGAILYVPLILLFVFLDMMKKHINPGSKKKKQSAHESNFSILYIISCLVSAGSYILTLFRGRSYNEMFFGTGQKLNQYFLACILIVAPTLCGVCAVLYNALKNGYPKKIFQVFAIAPLLLLLISRSNYYGIWIPFLVISLFLIVFYSIWQKSPAILAATCTFGLFFEKHKFLLFFVIMTTASLSMVDSSYLSSSFQTVFENLPY